MCAAKIFTLPLSHCTQRHPSAADDPTFSLNAIQPICMCVCVAYIVKSRYIFVCVCVQLHVHAASEPREVDLESAGAPLLFAISEADLI
jgi:hypothetical protein